MLRKFIAFLILLSILSGCAGNPTNTPTVFPQPSATPQSQLTPTPTPTPTQTQTSTLTPAPPTPTPEPAALVVNGESLSLADYNAELQRLQAALKELGKTSTPADQQKQVLAELENQFLLAQAASKDGYQLDLAAFQKRLETLVSQSGGAAAFADWQKANFYTDASFKQALSRSLAAAWERDRIADSVPTTADQVHARQILVLDEDTANRFYNLLKAGADFATLALQADPTLAGDLGWFPRGYLLLPEVEKAAFELESGKYSPIIKTAYGYHIVQVIERDPQHPLSADARLPLQRQALQSWLDLQRSKAVIQVLVPNP